MIAVMKRSLLKPKSNCACSLEFRCVHILPRERKDLKPIKFEIPFDLPAETLEFYISGIEQFNEQPKQVCWNASAHTPKAHSSISPYLLFFFPNLVFLSGLTPCCGFRFGRSLHWVCEHHH